MWTPGADRAASKSASVVSQSSSWDIPVWLGPLPGAARTGHKSSTDSSVMARGGPLGLEPRTLWSERKPSPSGDARRPVPAGEWVGTTRGLETPGAPTGPRASAIRRNGTKGATAEWPNGRALRFIPRKQRGSTPASATRFEDFKPPSGGSNRRKPSWDAAEKAKVRETAVRRCPRAARAREKVRGSSLTPDQRPTPTRARGHHDTRSTPNFER